jgi:hypothetical protein
MSADRAGLFAFIGKRLSWRKVPGVLDLLGDAPVCVVSRESHLPEALLGAEVMTMAGLNASEVLTHYGLAHVADVPIARMAQRDRTCLQIVRALECASGPIVFDGTFDARMWGLRRRPSLLAIAISEHDVALADHKQIMPPKRALLQFETEEPEPLRVALIAANLPASSTRSSVWLPITDSTTAARAQAVLASAGVPVSRLRTVATDP